MEANTLAGIEPFVHEMEDGRVHILVLPQDGKWELNVVDLRTAYDCAPQVAGFDRPEDALARGHAYVRQMDPGHDCQAQGCHFGLDVEARGLSGAAPGA